MKVGDFVLIIEDIPQFSSKLLIGRIIEIDIRDQELPYRVAVDKVTMWVGHAAPLTELTKALV